MRNDNRKVTNKKLRIRLVLFGEAIANAQWTENCYIHSFGENIILDFTVKYIVVNY